MSRKHYKVVEKLWGLGRVESLLSTFQDVRNAAERLKTIALKHSLWRCFRYLQSWGPGFLSSLKIYKEPALLNFAAPIIVYVN